MSAPIMYISARLVLITKASDAQYENVIQNTRRDVTIVALIGLVSKFLYTMVALLQMAVYTGVYYVNIGNGR